VPGRRTLSDEPATASGPRGRAGHRRPGDGGHGEPGALRPPARWVVRPPRRAPGRPSRTTTSSSRRTGSSIRQSLIGLLGLASWTAAAMWLMRTRSQPRASRGALPGAAPGRRR
jgi:hypothetical protein